MVIPQRAFYFFRHRVIAPAFLALSGFFCIANSASAQVEADTTLYLPFNGTLAGQQGEAPSISSGISFASGFSSNSGNAAVFPTGSTLTYTATGNIAATQGTLEFFVRPDWNGNDNTTHTFLTWGGGGGIVFSKDSANNLRSIFNRFGGANEAGVAINVSGWQAGQWHGVAYTWSNTDKQLNLYVDGLLANTNTFTINLPAVNTTNFYIGSDNGVDATNGRLDELRISSTVHSSAQIQARYAAFAATAAPEPSALALLLLGGGILSRSIVRRMPKK